MKAISVWQPYASLIVNGFKTVETRGYPAPKSILGQRIAIASTKNIVKAQRSAVAEESFVHHCLSTGLPRLDDLPCGYVLGSVVVVSSRPIDEGFVSSLSDRERAFGWYGAGRHAWLLRDPLPLADPVLVKGAQGFWEWRSHTTGWQHRT